MHNLNLKQLVGTRNETIDIAKGIVIVLVVFGHLTNTGEWQRILVHSFHMPFFMIMSGYCFHGGSISHIIVKAARRYLLVAYTTIGIDILIFYLSTSAAVPSALDWLSTFLLYGGLWRNTPIWFLFTLTICQILLALCVKISQQFLLLITLLLVCIDLFFVRPFAWWGTAVLFAFPFFCIGYLIQITNPLWIFAKIGTGKSFVSLFILITVGLWNGYTDMYTLTSGKSYLLFLVTGILGTICIVNLAEFISKQPKAKCIFQLFGTRTFIILISHYYICRMLIPKTLSFFHIEFVSGSLTFQVVTTIIIIWGYYRLFLCLGKWHEASRIHFYS